MTNEYAQISASINDGFEESHPLQLVNTDDDAIVIEIDNDDNENNDCMNDEKNPTDSEKMNEGQQVDEEEVAQEDTNEDEESRKNSREKIMESMLHILMGLVVGLTMYLSLIGLQSMINVIKDSLFRIKGGMNVFDSIMLTIFVATWGCLTLIKIFAIKTAFKEVIRKSMEKKHRNNIDEEDNSKNRTFFFIGMCIGNILSACIVSMMLVSTTPLSHTASDTTQNQQLERNNHHLELMVFPTLLFAITISFVLSTFHKNINNNQQQQRGLSLSSFLPWYATASEIQEQRQRQLQQIQLQQLYSGQSSLQPNGIGSN